MPIGRTLTIALLVLCATTTVAQEDPFAAWDRRYAKALSFAADSYEKLARWADRSKLPRSAARARRRILILLPTHEETRERFGYVQKEKVGWVWPADKRQAVRDLTDEANDKAEDFPRRLRLADRRIADRFRTLGKTADFRLRAEPDAMEKWNDRLFQTIGTVLRILPDDQDARKMLGHPEFEGRRVDPASVPFLKARAVRRQAGKTAARLPFEVLEMGNDRAIGKAGREAAVARTRHFTVKTTWGAERASKLVLAAQRALGEVLRVNRLPPEVADRKKLHTICILKNEFELEFFLKEVVRWDEAKIAKRLKRFTNAWFNDGSVAEHIKAEPRMVDGVMNYACRTVVRAARLYLTDELEEGEEAPKLEAWLLEGLTIDVMKRMTGESLTSFSEVPEYSHERRRTAGLDRWMVLARERIESDDDIDFARLVRQRLIDLDGAGAVKAYALIQYLFEMNAERARHFVQVALVHGAEAAAKEVYKKTLGELDAGYRRWVLLTW